MKRILSLICVLLLFLSGCGGAAPQDAPELLEPMAAQPRIAVAERSDIFDLIAAEGSLVHYYEPISFSVNGVIGEILVVPGQAVTAGQQLAVLDTEAMEESLEALEENRRKLVDNFALTGENLELTVRIRGLELEALSQSHQEALAAQQVLLTDAQTAMTELEAVQNQARAELEAWIEEIRLQIEALPEETEPEETAPGETESGGTEPEETAPGETEPEETEPVETEDREALEALLAELELQLEDMIAEHTATLAEAETAVRTQQETLDRLVSQQSVQYRLKELDVTEAKNALDHARENHAFQLEDMEKSIVALREEISKAVITAPFDGMLTWVSDLLQKGTYVTSEHVLMCVADPTRPMIQTERISSNRLDICDRLVAVVGDREYDLTAVAPSASDDVSRMLSGLPLYSQFLFADAAQTPDSAGFLVLCRYNYRENVLNIPINALLRDQSGAYVYVLRDGQRQRVNVTVGGSTELRVEILSGLEEGDVVYAED